MCPRFSDKLFCPQRSLPSIALKRRYTWSCWKYSANSRIKLWDRTSKNLLSTLREMFLRIIWSTCFQMRDFRIWLGFSKLVCPIMKNSLRIIRSKRRPWTQQNTRQQCQSRCSTSWFASTWWASAARARVTSPRSSVKVSSWTSKQAWLFTIALRSYGLSSAACWSTFAIVISILEAILCFPWKIIQQMSNAWRPLLRI